MLFPVLQGVTAKVLLAFSRVSYPGCSPAMVSTVLSLSPHQDRCRVVGFGAELEEPHTELLCSSPPFFTHLLLCAVWHKPWSWDHGEAVCQGQADAAAGTGAACATARRPSRGSRAGPGSL